MLSLTLQLPGDEWFLSYIKSVGSGVHPQDTSSWLWNELFSFMNFLFEKFTVLPAEVTNTLEEDSDGAGMFVFPVELHIRQWRNSQAEGIVALERMINGHLGCNEDNFRLSFSTGEKLLTLGCLSFCFE